MKRSRLPRYGQAFSRVVLPVALFIVVVGGIAWITQYMPDWRQQRKPRPSPEDSKAANNLDLKLLKFESPQAIWDKEDPTYAKEFEKGVTGSYDYRFENLSGEKMIIGVKAIGCSCSSVEVAVSESPLSLLSDPSALDFKKLQKDDKADEKSGVEVPAGGSGIVRVSWKREMLGDFTAHAELWCIYQGKRMFRVLNTPICVREPLMFLPDKITVGAVAQKVSKQFKCWSATRKDIKLEINDKDNPCYVYTIRTMDEAERKKLQEELREASKDAKVKSLNSRVLSGFVVNVDVYEEKDGHYLDLGYFEHSPPIEISDSKNPTAGKPLELSGPPIKGSVSGDVTVGNPEDQGKINLGQFNSDEAYQKSFAIYTADPKAELKLIDEPTKDAKSMVFSAKLTKNDKASTPSKGVWALEISIPASRLFGPLPDNSFIMLQISPARRIRIPVTGSSRPRQT